VHRNAQAAINALCACRRSPIRSWCWMNLQVRQHRTPVPPHSVYQAGALRISCGKTSWRVARERVAAVPGRATRYSCTSCRWAWAKTACVGTREGLRPKFFHRTHSVSGTRDPVGGGDQWGASGRRPIWESAHFATRVEGTISHFGGLGTGR
jgi:hypothetical protein